MWSILKNKIEEIYASASVEYQEIKSLLFLNSPSFVTAVVYRR